MGTRYQLKGSIGLSAPGSNFGSASFISHRSLINNYPLTGMQADIAVNIPDLVAGTVHASIFSTANFSFNTYLQTHSKLGSALGGASARVAFRHRSTDSFSFSVAVSNVMTMPGSITLSGDISSTGGYSTDFFLCIAYYSLNASVRARVKGGGSTPFSMAVRGAANAKAGSGSLGVGIGVNVNVNFKYTEPATFSLSVSLSFDFGVYTWNPTVLSA